MLCYDGLWSSIPAFVVLFSSMDKILTKECASDSGSLFTRVSASECLMRLPYYLGDGISEVDVSVVDSISGKRILFPGRGSKCDHIDVVDVVNSVGSVSDDVFDDPWVCPICGNLYDRASEVEIDELLQEAFSSLEHDTEATSIKLRKDGTWSVASVSDCTKDVRGDVGVVKRKSRALFDSTKPTKPKVARADDHGVVDLDSSESDEDTGDSTKKISKESIDLVDESAD